MKSVFTTVGLGFLFSQSSSGSSGSSSSSTSKLNLFFAYLHYQKIKDKNGMMSKTDIDKIFKFNNKGLLLDGKDKRLSIKNSCNHLAVISRTGGGKTSTFVLPNIYKLANDKCSMVITDLSGEIYEKNKWLFKK